MKVLRISQFGIILSYLCGVTNVFAASGGHGDAALPTKPLIYAAINFVLIILLLGYFLRKPAKEFFASRAVLIKKDIDDSQALKAEATAKYQEYETRLQGIENEMKSLIGELKNDGQLEKGRIIEVAHEQVKNLKNTSQRVMAQELRRAKEELKREAVNLAADLAEELIRKNITPEDQQRLVKKYIDKMEHLS